MPLVELHDVEARYGEIKALHGVTLSVEDGEVQAALGATPVSVTGTNVGASGARYPQGLYRRPGGVLHVSPGLGTTFVPFRFAARPEATELVLQSI